MALAVPDPIGSVTQSLVAAFAKDIFKFGMPLRRRLRSAGPTSVEGQICELNSSNIKCSGRRELDPPQTLSLDLFQRVISAERFT
jgi:hypothetical protein